MGLDESVHNEVFNTKNLKKKHFNSRKSVAGRESVALNSQISDSICYNAKGPTSILSKRNFRSVHDGVLWSGVRAAPGFLYWQPAAP